MVEVNARLKVLNGAASEDLQITDDAGSPTGRALPVLDATARASLGTDGTDPPAVLGSGTGVRGWLRSIYEKLTGTIAVANGPILEASGTAGALNADAIASTDVSAYRALSLMVTGTYSGTLTFQGSNNGTTWISVALMSAGSTTSAPGSTTASTGVLFAGPVNFRFFRVRMTSYTSGTAAVSLVAFTAPVGQLAVGGQIGAVGVIAHDAVDSGNPVKIGGKANTAAPAAVAALDRVDAWFGVRGEQMVQLRDSAGTELGTAAAPLTTKDDYQAGECLAEQSGDGTVKTFTFASPVQLVHVEANGADTDVARVDPFGGTPTATQGFRASDGIGIYLPVTCTIVRVWAPAGMVLTVNGFRRA